MRAQTTEKSGSNDSQSLASVGGTECIAKFLRMVRKRGGWLRLLLGEMLT